MRLKFTLFTLLLLSVAASVHAQAKPHWSFGASAFAVYQQPRYVDTDFTGIDNFEYRSKLQWMMMTNATLFPDDRFYIRFAAGMRDAGWRKINDDPSLEPHWTKTDYTFLFALLDLSVGTSFSKYIPLLNPTIGFTQQFGVSTKETTFFQDGHAEQTDSFVFPNDYPNSLYIAFNHNWNLGAHSTIEFQYRCEFGLKKYHDVIVRSPQIVHALGINYSFLL